VIERPALERFGPDKTPIKTNRKYQNAGKN